MKGIQDRVGTFETDLRTEAMIASWFDGLHPIVVVEQEDEIIAYASTLRSVAVNPDHRGLRLGNALVQRMLRDAQNLGVHEVYLLTETAVRYFPRFGFRAIPRAAVEPSVHASLEWTSVCPLTAQAMVATLGNARPMKEETSAAPASPES